MNRACEEFTHRWVRCEKCWGWINVHREPYITGRIDGMQACLHRVCAGSFSKPITNIEQVSDDDIRRT